MNRSEANNCHRQTKINFRHNFDVDKKSVPSYSNNQFTCTQNMNEEVKIRFLDKELDEDYISDKSSSRSEYKFRVLIESPMSAFSCALLDSLNHH